MKKYFKNIFLWIYMKIHSMLINISIALYNTENEILKADPNDLDEKNNHTQRMRSRSQLLEKFYAGQRDEKYVKDYYELLRKADKFMRTATPHQMAVAADKYGTSYGMKDQYGRRYEHYGFFDEKHKHAGKTVGEVIIAEFDERRTKDDEYELLYMFNNKPIEVGLANIMDILEKPKEENANFEYQVVDVFRKSKQFEFPIKVLRTNEKAVNKIEQLSEYLHVKKIGFEYRQLEFFVPLKFKTMELPDDSEIFKEIIDIKEVFMKDDYGQLIGFGIIKFVKRIKHNDTHEVLKFEGIEMENVGQ
jgi:hypothetical protein